MMTCDALRNRLLAEPDPTRAPAELRGHLTDCLSCREFLAHYKMLAKAVAALPAPDSELAKIAFVESLSQAGPIIKSIPALTASGHSFSNLWSLVAKPLAATAAAVAVGFGIWAVLPTKQPTQEYASPRHELLKKVVATNASLAKTGDPKLRIATLSDLAYDLRGETRDVINAAPEEELVALAGMYEDVVVNGLVKQAKQLNPMNLAVKDRLEILNAAADKLAATADEANDQVRIAPPQAQAALKKISKAAKEGREQLLRIARGEGA